MRRPLPALAAVALPVALLAGCAVTPPLVAFPGQGKSYADFQADDSGCRAAVIQGAPRTQAAPAVAPRSPNLAYAQCMVSKGDRVGPPPPPPIYAGGAVYSGFGDTFPWEYGF